MTELEKRLQTMEDMEAIRSFHNDYIFYLNSHQWDAMADCFTEDAYALIHEPCHGKEAIHRHFTERIAKLNTVNTRNVHFATQPVIIVDGQKAKSHWQIYIMISDQATGSPLKWIPGRYDCEYAKINGQWKFSSMIYTSPWPA
jgi:ketosteroid isomerase-like protein